MNKPKVKSRTKDNSIQKLLVFIEEELPNFVNSSEFTDILAAKKNENQHSTAFCVFMSNQNRLRKKSYVFQGQVAQKGSHSIDVGFYVGSALIFVMEAKVLPTPNGTLKKPRDIHEYVYRNVGAGAGIERFKQEVHGVDNAGNLLAENGMIAYIKDDQTFDAWLAQVNAWIDNAGWGSQEHLTANFGFYESKHERTSGVKVTLHHFWVKV